MSDPEDRGGTAGGDERPAMKIDDVSTRRPSHRSLLRAKRWFVLTADRWLVTAILLAGVFLAVVLVGKFGPMSLSTFRGGGVSTGEVLVELLKSIVSVVVIVLSINQLVLSPGLGPVGDQQERYDDAMDLRRRAEQHTDERVSPTSPARFFGALMAAVLEQTDRLRAGGSPVDPDVEEFIRSVEREGLFVHRELETVRLGQYGVVQTLLRFSISEKVNALRTLQRVHGDDLTDDQRDAVGKLDELLELFTVSREYIKTIYIRSEYVNLSRGPLYVGPPSIVGTYLTIQIYGSSAFTRTTLGISNQLLFVAVAVTVALVPFMLLVAFVLRLVTLSESTLFVGPFNAGGAIGSLADPLAGRELKCFPESVLR